MADRNDLKKAKEKIKLIIEKGQEIQKSAPYLKYMEANLDWLDDTCDVIKDKENEILKPLTAPLQEINNITLESINVPSISGMSAAFMSASAAETRETILSSDDDYHYLLKEYDNIYKIDGLFCDISEKLKLIDPALLDEFNEVKNCYYNWKSGLKTNSDLAKETRTFMEHFKGAINKLRVPKTNWGKVEIPDKSWNKMVDKISKKGNGNKKAFMQQKKLNEDLRQELTLVMKKTKTVNNETMESLFKRSVEHIYAVVHLIDENILNQ